MDERGIANGLNETVAEGDFWVSGHAAAALVGRNEKTPTANPEEDSGRAAFDLKYAAPLPTVQGDFAEQAGAMQQLRGRTLCCISVSHSYVRQTSFGHNEAL